MKFYDDNLEAHSTETLTALRNRIDMVIAQRETGVPTELYCNYERNLVNVVVAVRRATGMGVSEALDAVRTNKMVKIPVHMVNEVRKRMSAYSRD